MPAGKDLLEHRLLSLNSEHRALPPFSSTSSKLFNDRSVLLRLRCLFMNVDGIIWLESIVEKLAVKHGVETYEVEEALDNRPKIRFVQKGDRAGEDVYMALSRTDAGRYLAVLFIYETSREALIISSRDMADKERRQYGRR